MAQTSWPARGLDLQHQGVAAHGVELVHIGRDALGVDVLRRDKDGAQGLHLLVYLRLDIGVVRVGYLQLGVHLLKDALALFLLRAGRGEDGQLERDAVVAVNYVLLKGAEEHKERHDKHRHCGEDDAEDV